MKNMLILLSLVLHVFLASASFAGDPEQSLARDLSACGQLVRQLAATGGTLTSDELQKLQTVAVNLHADRLLLAERQNSMEQKTATLGGKAGERHSAVSAPLLLQLDDLLTRLDALSAASPPAELEAVRQLIDTLIPRKKRPLLGTLPYQNLNYPAREPSTAPLIKPAFKGGNRTVSAADTAATPEAPISKEIAELAQSFNWKPIPIYEWMKNNVTTEWYWGCMKGAEETLRQMSGNDCDQAALFAALLRASGYPTRFVRGSIDFFPDISKAKNLTGLADPMKIAAFFQKAGIPFKPIIAGGTIDNFQIEHIWVESYIPYANYRGTVADDTGKTWLALETSIKPPGLSRNLPLDFPAFPASSLFDEYLQTVRTDTPLEFVKTKTEAYLNQNNIGKTYQDFLATAAIIPDILKILPASLQYNAKTITGEYTQIPEELKHKVRFTAKNGTNELFTITLDTLKLSNKKVAITYEPETVEDQNTIDSFGGLDNTPPYLVRLRSVLKVDGERIMVAQDGLPMGTEYTLELTLISPNGTETTSSSQTTGNLSVIGIVAQKATQDTTITAEDDAETILFKEANSYINRWSKAEDELAAFLKLSLSRPIPTIVTVGGQIDVTWLLDIPHGFEWKGVFIDAGLRRIEAVTSAPGSNKEKDFMRLSALQGSILENRIFEDDFKVDSISTAKLLQIAKTNNIPILTIDRTNSDAILPTLAVDQAIKEDIANAVNQNLTVTIPTSETVYRDWSGIGYAKENKESGESGWMLSGGIAGGMTAVSRGKWTRQDIVNKLATPYRPKTIQWETGPFLVHNLNDSSNIATMQAVGSYDASFSDKAAIEATRQAVSKEYFKTHADLDFLVILSTFDYKMPETDTQGFYLEAKNDTLGIGRDQFDFSSRFGSSGRLQGTIDLGNITSRNLEESITTLSHELSHRFGAYVKYTDSDGNINSSLLGKDNAHWSYLLDSKGSLLYGNGWQTNPDNTYTSTAVRDSYSPLDLYLMGIIPKEQVPPMLLIDNPNIDRTKLPKLGDTITGTPKTVTINDIIAAEGERIPTAADSPKTFTIGYVLLKRPGDNISNAAQKVELLRKGFAGRFNELTQRKGSISGVATEVALQIETPIEGEIITGPDVTVTGTVINTTGSTETGVTINGIPATVSGSSFIANHVPLQTGSNTISVTATDVNGLTTTTTRTITAQAGHYLRINSNIESGTGPLEVSLRLNGSFSITNPQLNVSGPAVATLQAGASENEYTLKMTVEGSYSVTVSAQGPDGNSYSDTVTVTVVSKTQLETLLKAKWEGMKAALAVGDVVKAVSNFSELSKGKYQQQFTALTTYLPQIASEMGSAQLVKADAYLAEFDLRTRRNSIDYSFLLLFVKDRSGIWKIRNF